MLFMATNPKLALFKHGLYAHNRSRLRSGYDLGALAIIGPITDGTSRLNKWQQSYGEWGADSVGRIYGASLGWVKSGIARRKSVYPITLTKRYGLANLTRDDVKVHDDEKIRHRIETARSSDHAKKTV